MTEPLNLTLTDIEVFTAVEAAVYLKVTVKTVRELAASGRLPGRKVGKAWRFLRKTLDEWLSGDKSEEEKWQSEISTVTGISTLDIVDEEYAEALDLK